MNWDELDYNQRKRIASKWVYLNPFPMTVDEKLRMMQELLASIQVFHPVEKVMERRLKMEEENRKLEEKINAMNAPKKTGFSFHDL